MTRRVGQFRDGEIPIFFRCRFDTDREIPGISFKQGVLLCLCGLGERNLLLEMPYTGHDVRDLAHRPMSMLPQ